MYLLFGDNTFGHLTRTDGFICITLVFIADLPQFWDTTSTTLMTSPISQTLIVRATRTIGRCVNTTKSMSAHSICKSAFNADVSYDDVIKWKHFFALLPLCAGNSPMSGEFPSQRPVTRSIGVSLICTLDKRLSKQSWGRCYVGLWHRYV